MTGSGFWKGKRVLLTGHTGFKGSWLSYILTRAGAELTGYALAPDTAPNLFSICRVERDMRSVIGDIRDRDRLMEVFREARPEVVIHMAAQPLVLDSYRDPVYTYETNVMGTVNLLECARLTDGVQSLLNVTTDKVYNNSEWAWGYRESDPLDGYDPYSNSKSCSELVTHSYQRSFLQERGVAVSTARAGNVIGGGDFAADRIIPDCIRAAEQGRAIFVRNPHSTRPYQHVLEPLFAYLLIAEKQLEDAALAGCYNVGPIDQDCVNTGQLADLFCESWGEGLRWETGEQAGPHEANYLKLDCSKIRSALGWEPRWRVADAVGKTVEWAKAHGRGEDILSVMDKQIYEYSKAGKKHV